VIRSALPGITALVTPYLEIIAREWAARAAELADWAYANLVNRTDVWGSYLPLAKRARQTFFTAPFPAARGKEFLTKAHLARHFAGLDGHLLSLHSTSADRRSRWIAVDIDRHERDEESTPQGNLAAALAWHDRLVELGFDPLLLDTNGRGGFHLWIVFSEPVATADLFAWGGGIIADWERRGLPRAPETYPGRPFVEEGAHGDCLRLPGLHPTYEHFTKVWSAEPDLAEPWLEGGGAVERILQTRLAPPSLLPASPSAAEPARPPRRASRRERPRVCVDLDGVLAEYSGWQGIDFTGAPLPGAVDFARRLSEFADLVVFTTRCSAEPNRAELGEPSRPAGDLAPRLLQKVKYWLDKHDFPYAEIYIGQGKPPASAYVDDRAVRCSPQEDPRAFDSALARVRELCGGPRVATDPRLARILEAWPSLPEEVRAEIAARVSRRP
jgi:hypothetical protein